MTLLVTCDVSGIQKPDARMVDALARVQCEVTRAGGEMRLQGVCESLCELIEFMGLADVLRVESRRQPE